MNQYAALEALRAPQDASDRMRAVFLQRRDRIVAGLNQIPGFRCLIPGGAFYVWPNVTEACRMVGRRRQRGPAQASPLRGRGGGAGGRPLRRDHPRRGEHLRFSYASSFEDIDRGLTRIADYLRKHTR
jgi:aspartate/methionine/tyrosine aminotransferase